MSARPDMAPGMTRPIKFRAWDKDMSVMRTVIDLTWRKRNGLTVGVQDGSQVRVELFPDEYELMEFTGLTDKTGREIYEGDIVHERARNITAEVVWRHESSSFQRQPKMKGSARLLWELWPIDQENYEVIGNIHQNPELLK